MGAYACCTYRFRDLNDLELSLKEAEKIYDLFVWNCHIVDYLEYNLNLLKEKDVVTDQDDILLFKMLEDLIKNFIKTGKKLCKLKVIIHYNIYFRIKILLKYVK